MATGASGGGGGSSDLSATSLSVSGPTTLSGQINLSGDVYLNRPVYFKDGVVMIDPKTKSINLTSIKADSSSVGSLFTQTATTTTTNTSLASSQYGGGEDRELGVATSTFSSVSAASVVSNTTSASTALRVTKTAKNFNRNITATEQFNDMITVGPNKYKAQQIRVRTLGGKDVTLLAYVLVA